MSANPTSGEVSIELGGEEYVLRPSYQAIVAFEQQTGSGIVELARRADDMTMTADHAAIVATECIKAWGRATENKSAAGANAKRIAELVIEAGLVVVLRRLALVLFLAATGGYTASGEAKPATKKSKTPVAG